MKLFLLISGGTLLIDQSTKAIIPLILDGGSVEILPGLLNLVYTKNPGVAFGLLRDLPSTIRLPLLVLASIGGIGLILYLQVFKPPQRMAERLALPLILGGILGNLVDRIRYGAVVDFIDLHIGAYHWPAFNTADSAITIGALLLIIGSISPPHPR